MSSNNSSSSSSRKETERTKLIQEKCQTLLTQMLRDEDNKYCVDCDAKGPRWASWNLGVFLCIRCAGIHRNLGVHISRVKSVNLDTWTPEQVISLQQMGNSRARAVYEAQLPDGFRRPQTDTALESFIRAKYEHKKYLAREWVPPSPPKVDWAKEIDEELERQKRKKKAAQAGSAIGIGIVGGSASTYSSVERKTNAAAAKAPLPPPLPKPKPSNSPKSHRLSESSSSSNQNSSLAGTGSSDLLGLASPTKPVAGLVNLNNDSHSDSFSGFLSAAPVAAVSANDSSLGNGDTSQSGASVGPNSLAKEEEDFFNQTTSLGGGAEKDKAGKLTKDSILALYGAAPATNPQAGLGQFSSNPLAGGFSNNLTQNKPFPALLVNPNANTGGMGMPPGLMGPPQPQAQFMTPPNSASMYNAPVMTAPAAFTSPAAGGMSYHPQMMGVQTTGFAQFPPMQATYPAAAGAPGMMSAFGAAPTVGAGGGGIMATGQGLMQMNPALNQGLMGMQMNGPMVQPAAAAPASNLSQQFGNLNIGNVWQ